MMQRHMAEDWYFQQRHCENLKFWITYLLRQEHWHKYWVTVLVPCTIFSHYYFYRLITTYKLKVEGSSLSQLVCCL